VRFPIRASGWRVGACVTVGEGAGLPPWDPPTVSSRPPTPLLKEDSCRTWDTTRPATRPPNKIRAPTESK